MLRIRNRRSGAELGEIFQADIYADAVFGVVSVGTCFALDTKRDIPAIGFASDDRALWEVSKHLMSIIRRLYLSAIGRLTTKVTLEFKKSLSPLNYTRTRGGVISNYSGWRWNEETVVKSNAHGRVGVAVVTSRWADNANATVGPSPTRSTANRYNKQLKELRPLQG